MDNTRCLILLAFALCLLSIAFADCNASISPNFSIGIDFLSSDNPVDDETVVAEQLVKETIPEDVEKLLKSIENEPWFNEGFVDKEGSKACREYSELDEKVVLEIEKGGKDRSSKQTKWARGRFDAWRRHFKKEFTVSPETPIEDILLLQLNDMVMRFLLQVRKKDGSLFPPGSLNCLLKGIGRIVRKKQEVTVNLTGDLKEPPFNILRDLRFGKARLGFVAAACDKARKEGVGVKKKKAVAIPFNTEKDLLADLDFQIHSPKGIQKRLC